MANSYSTQDIIKGVLQRCGENTDGTSSYHELALKYVNDVYLSVLSGANEFDIDVGQPWTWARIQKYTLLAGFYETGSVNVTINSLSGTFTNPPAISVAGYFLNCVNTENYYVIESHTAGSPNFVLASPCLEATAAYGFKAIPLVLDLGPGILRLVEPLRIDIQRTLEYSEDASDMGRIYGIGIDQFRAEYPFYQLMNDTPTKFTVISESESSLKVQFNRYPTDPIKITYDVIEIPDGLVDINTDIPVIPRNYRKVLEFGAAHFIHKDKHNDTDASYYFNLTKATLMAMLQAEKKRAKLIASSYAELIPRLDDTVIPYWLIQR